MSAYTDEELLAVARVVWPNCTSSTVLYGRSRDALAYGMLRASEPKYTGAVEFVVRLALAHPERAGEALGPGWSLDGQHFNWRSDTPGLFLRVAEGVVQLSAWCAAIPPEFDAALARARLIAAAWQRIEASNP